MRRPDAKPRELDPKTLYAEHGERVYRFCLRLCGGRAADAEDLAQDVLVLAWQHRDGFTGRAALSTWLFRIALNRWHRLRGRAEAKAAAEAAPLDEERAGTRMADPLRQTLARMELTRALETLPDPLREAFLLVKVEGLKYREAAQVLGLPQGTVSSHVHEATLRLRVALADASEATSRRPAANAVAANAPKEAAHAL